MLRLDRYKVLKEMSQENRDRIFEYAMRRSEEIVRGIEEPEEERKSQDQREGAANERLHKTGALCWFCDARLLEHAKDYARCKGCGVFISGHAVRARKRNPDAAITPRADGGPAIFWPAGQR